MELTEALEQTEPGLFAQVESAIFHQQLNLRAQRTYLHWIGRFVLFHQPRTPETLEWADKQAFLHHLQDQAQLSRARLNQARQAVTFFLTEVLQKDAAMAETA